VNLSRKQVVAGVALVATTILGATQLGAVLADDAGAQAAQAVGGVAASAPAGPVGADTTPNELSRAFRRAAERAMPGVVRVEVEVEGRSPFQGTPLEDFFRGGPRGSVPRTGHGSGFIFRPDGYILTNNHVVEGARRVTVVLQDKREFEARVVGRDPNTDVAVLKIDAQGLPVVPLGDSDPVAVGDWVVALGYPLELGATVTAGIVSAKGRSLGIIGRREGLEHFIQTDAAINPGNSGGPLVDLNGRAIGINSAIRSNTGYYSGYGFAIPINLAKRVADDLIRYGAVRRPKLGVQVSDVTSADAEVYRLERPMGAEVVGIEAGSAAERAGIQLGDVIVGVDGKPIEDSGELTELLARRQPGEKVTLDVVRYGKRLRISAELGTFEPAVKASEDTSSERDGGLARLGFQVRDLTPELARRLDLEGVERGVVIVDVEELGPAGRAGLRPGMVIESVNGREVQTVRDLERAARELRPGQAVSLVVRRPEDGSRTIVNYRIRR
jgi:serine protease Do